MYALSSLLLLGLASAMPHQTQHHKKPLGYDADFDPYAYNKTFASCPAVDRGGLTPVDINLKLAYIDINPTAKNTLIMVHGFPGLWTTWRNQIKTLGRDYRLIIPEHRGYGDSEHPHDLYESNTMPDFVNDIMCMMDHAGVASGVLLGHDFGAQVTWEAARMRPDRFLGVFNADIPYVSSALPFAPTEKLVELAPGFGYQLYFSNNATGGAVELDASPRDAIRSCAQTGDDKVPEDFLKATTTFLQPWYANGAKEVPASGIMSQKVEDYMVESYKKQGFYNTFNGYQRRNRYDTWQFERAQGNFTISQPTFVLYPTRDPVADWAKVGTLLGSSSFLLNTYNATTPTAHWPMEERPAEFDNFFREWIGNVTFPSS